MNSIFFFLGILASIVLLGSSAKAQNYPWCAENRSLDGSMNCGFESFEQCMATLGRNGGFCIRNNTYQPPSQSEPSTPVGVVPVPNEAPSRTNAARR